MVKTQEVAFQEISPSEFFYRNRELAGFTNPTRALYAGVRELVENSLDATELYSILPEVQVHMTDLEPASPDPKSYAIKVVDNGPGIEPKQLPYAFGKVFYGSKFRLRQSRGMFGMGGTMAILYGQITTNKPVRISTCQDGKLAHNFSLIIDIQENKPIILEQSSSEAQGGRGLSIEIFLMGDYPRAGSKIQEYFKQVAMVTPYANISFRDPFGTTLAYGRVTTAMPKAPEETLPHPYGIDVEAMRRIIKECRENSMLKFLPRNFHRVGERTALSFLTKMGFDTSRDPKSLTNDDIVALVNGLHRFKDFLQPASRCLSPLGEELLRAGIEKELKPEFIATASRPPSAYSGFPFCVEIAVAYGGESLRPGTTIYRFANRIPLLYDEASDVTWKVVKEDVDWKRYSIPQDGPIAVVTHFCSTKIPYKTVGKEFIADRPELERELRNAIRDALRKVSLYLSRKGRMEMVKRKMNIYGKYLPLLAKFSAGLAGMNRLPRYRALIEEGEGGIQERLDQYSQSEKGTGQATL